MIARVHFGSVLNLFTITALTSLSDRYFATFSPVVDRGSLFITPVVVVEYVVAIVFSDGRLTKVATRPFIDQCITHVAL